MINESQRYTKRLFIYLFIYFPGDFEILGWCPAGTFLSLWGERASLALVDHPSSDGITIKRPYGVDVLHRPASHSIFSYWVG